MTTMESIRIKNKIKFAKVNPNAIIPTKRDEDAGYDIYACFDEEYMLINPHQTVLVPTGITSAFSNDYVIIMKERGSTGSKGMGQRCGVIDSGYRGEWFISMTNHNDKPLIITKQNDTSNLEDDYVVYPYSKAICQALLLPLPCSESVEITYDELCNIKSERGNGNIGSSGK